MIFSRRKFLAAGSLGVTARAMRQMKLDSAPAPKLINMSEVTPFVDPLPTPDVLKPQGTRASRIDRSRSAPSYRVPISQFEVKVHRDLRPTTFWGYGGSVPGPTIEVRKGEPVFVEWVNQLPAKHLFAVDHKIMGAEADKPEVRTVAHVHGGVVPPESDGYPENWFTRGQSATSFYPNRQDAALLWYHDHAMGITRLNMMAGLFGLYVIRDEEEDALRLPAGEFEKPLVLFDRTLRSDGQLYYPVSQDPKAPWIPEFFGDCTLVNGALLPYLAVEPRAYRFRILNASNARFYSLSLTNNAHFTQIGTDGGLLSRPVEMSEMMIIPGDRADVIIDFGRHAGETLVLQDGVSPIVQLRVKGSTQKPAQSLPATLRRIDRIPERAAVRTRNLTLEEYDNLLDEPMTHLLDGKRWHEPVSEMSTIDTTEIWSFFNLTEDAHPIHLHLVRFQVLDRRPLDVPEYIYNKRIRYTGDSVQPDANEMGWKDTVRAAPKSVTRIIIHFQGYLGRYVWHCHIAEHEDNEMMRPYDVLPAKA